MKIKSRKRTYRRINGSPSMLCRMTIVKLNTIVELYDLINDWNRDEDQNNERKGIRLCPKQENQFTKHTSCILERRAQNVVVIGPLKLKIYNASLQPAVTQGNLLTFGRIERQLGCLGCNYWKYNYVTQQSLILCQSFLVSARCPDCKSCCYGKLSLYG